MRWLTITRVSSSDSDFGRRYADRVLFPMIYRSNLIIEAPKVTPDLF